MAELAGKTALVTGGARGIGAAIVRRLGAAGVHVAINYAGSKAAAEGYTQAYLDDCNRYDRGAVESLAKASK